MSAKGTKRKMQAKVNPKSGLARKNPGPRNLDEYLATSDNFKESWNRAEHVVSKVRNDGLSLRQASQEFHISPRTVIRLAGSALRKRRNGKYAARSRDQLLRVLVIPTPDGLREIGVRDSREASLIGKYWAAVQKYLETGDAIDLRRIRRKQIKDADDKRIVLVKDLSELDRLGSAGVLSFESLYAKVA
jgi:hypothetical protein